ncbi:arginine--tRNA ligase [Dactylosporangium sp. CA-139066]|uniref:arginine--tRNA ligase n=1 Tax=Dactylosporangium sp. CA-139066 TaxID=3239930 RepID=UPI003D924AA9
MADIGTLLRDRLAAAFETVTGSTVDPVLRRSQRADFQANGALALKDRSVAAEVVAAAGLGDLCSRVEVAGPGYINLTVADETLNRMLAATAADERLGVSTVEPETVLVDYSGPNVAKEMHVGHLRSTVIGDAAARVLEFLGHRVIRQNHIGDWGTNFGMLVEHHVEGGVIDERNLSAFYAGARERFTEDDGFRDRARRRAVALQDGDPETVALWRSFVGISRRYLTGVYDQLGVRLRDEDIAGESDYVGALDGIVAELQAKGLLHDSDGALCAFPEGFNGPLIVRKSDGGYGYAATDLAALKYRCRTLGATRLLYVVGAPQRQHLEMVFAVGRAAGWLVPPARAQHVSFGSVLGLDGRMLRSRTGRAVQLAELLDEAISRARAPEIAMGALKYADLSTDRNKDYVYDPQRMLAFTGDTGPYVQYANVRARSILAKAGGDGPRREFAVAGPVDHALAVELLGFPGVVAQAGETLELHRLAGYLHDLAAAFTTFFERAPVLRGQEREGRLALCELTSRTLRTGLDLLGIQAPDRM